MLDVIRVLLFVVFTFSSLLLIIVILLQEGKGGGLASAFGGAGADTFGVSAGGINRFTATLAVVFIGCAVILAATASTSVAPPSDTRAEEVPADEGVPGDDDDTGSRVTSTLRNTAASPSSSAIPAPTERTSMRGERRGRGSEPCSA